MPSGQPNFNFFQPIRNKNGQFAKWEKTEEYYLDKERRKKERNRKIGLANKGRTLSAEVRMKISINRKGKAMGKQNPFYGKKLTPEQHKKWYDSIRKIKLSKEELENLYVDSSIGELSERFNVAPSTVWLTLKNLGVKIRSPHERGIRLWQNKEYRETVVKKALEGSSRRPTSAENKVIHLIDKHKLPFKYVGDGSIVIDRLCPDFIDSSNKKIIEVFGDYWHSSRNPQFSLSHTEARRREIFSKAGYDLLVIWEHELNNEEIVSNKIKDYVR